MNDTKAKPVTLPSSGAFNRALAGESIPDGLNKYFSDENRHYQEVFADLMLQYAQTVAYKVYHNLRCGHEMDMAFDPLQYVDCGSNKAIPHDLFVRLVKYIREPDAFTEEHYSKLAQMFLEAKLD